MAMLTKEQILGADDLPKEELSVKEWGGSVFVRTMSGAERDAFERDMLTIKGKSTEANLANARAKLCARAICDDKGERIFTDDEIEKLGKKSAKALDRVFAVAKRLNGIGEDDVKELTGNS